MILDQLNNSERYVSLHPGFKAAFEWLRNRAHAKLSVGRHDIAGDALYASVMSEKGRGSTAAKFETHRRYIDIQYVIEGSDVMGWTHAGSGLGSLGYDPAKDLEFYGARPELWIPVPAGTFTIFFPEDAHAPLAGTESMVKVVMKVAV